MGTFADAAQEILTRGIDAYAEVQRARYSANDPTPNRRGDDVTTREGEPVTDAALGETVRETFTNPTNLLLLGVAVLLVVMLARR